ncbi:SMP-30/gluconolactonase/LRE family protein [Streptomyces sp. NBC_00344]|uniref:SMP-30/gluconolactonase/LRE family protein n=1 Tax=Streptomyces sp. NBC_00344 TaxID=2975720 RepID=UPI002E1CD4F7
MSDYTDGTVLEVPADGGSGTDAPITGLTRPTGMALNAAGDLYVSDTGNNRVVKVPGNGGPQTVVPATDLSRPIGLALDAAGNLFISDSFNNRVVEVPADGGPQTTVPTTGLVHPDGLALDALGNLFVADFSNDRVVKVPADGGPQTTVPARGLSQPTGLAFDSDGDLYISDSANGRVVKMPVDGGPQETVPTSGLRSPQGLVLDAVDNLFVADFGNDRVVEVPANGGGQSTLPVSGLSTPVGLAVPPAPVPPTNVTAAPGHAQATVSFIGSASPAVTGYIVTAIDLTKHSRGGQVAQGPGSPITVTSLTPGDSYEFTVTGTNAAGATSLNSAPSPAVTIRRVPTRLAARPASMQQRSGPSALIVRGLHATLSEADGTPLARQLITFTNTARTRQLCTAVSDVHGVAHCEATVPDRTRGSRSLYDDLRHHGYLATFRGSTTYRSVVDTAPVRVRHRP